MIPIYFFYVFNWIFCTIYLLFGIFIGHILYLIFIIYLVCGHIHWLCHSLFQECCVRCSGKIFEPERFKTKYFSYHRKCLFCKSCKRSLTSSLSEVVTGPDNDVYCAKCQRPNPGVCYSDPQSIMAMDGKGCPRCKGQVFTAEQIVEKGRTFHVGCFSCFTCKRPLKDRVNADNKSLKSTI